MMLQCFLIITRMQGYTKLGDNCDKALGFTVIDFNVIGFIVITVIKMGKQFRQS